MSILHRVTVIENHEIADAIFELRVRGDIVRKLCAPGQFVHIRVGDGSEHMLRRPISICEIDHAADTFTMIFRREGAGTARLASLRAGDEIDLLAPLGKGFPVTAARQSALLVGGGIGVPPLFELSKQLNRRGIETVHVLGFQSAKDTFYLERFAGLGATHVATVDGTLGRKGFVTDVIADLPVTFDVFYSCGPKAMLSALTEQLTDVPGYISLEERMGCGVGVCFACVCKARNDSGYVKVCTDGPVFDSREVIV